MRNCVTSIFMHDIPWVPVHIDFGSFLYLQGKIIALKMVISPDEILEQMIRLNLSNAYLLKINYWTSNQHMTYFASV